MQALTHWIDGKARPATSGRWLEVFDPAYFIDFKFEDGDPIKLVGAPPSCKLQFQRPNDGTAASRS